MTLAPSVSDAYQDELVALIPYVRAFARSLCRDRAQADDLAQDALASAWRDRGDSVTGTNLRARVLRLLRNRFYSERRRGWRICRLGPREAAQTLGAVGDPSGALHLDDVRRAMQELSDEQREALTLIGAAGMSYDEAAAICGCSSGAIRSRVSRARQRLLARLSRRAPMRRIPAPDGVMASMIVAAERLRLGAVDEAARAAATHRSPFETPVRPTYH